MAYEALLSVVVDLLGGQEESVLQGAADEVLAVLKNDRLRVSWCSGLAGTAAAPVGEGAWGGTLLMHYTWKGPAQGRWARVPDAVPMSIARGVHRMRAGLHHHVQTCLPPNLPLRAKTLPPQK